MNKTLNVYDLLNDSEPISEESGLKLYDKINCLRNEECSEIIVIDFSQIDGLTTAFVNNSIGKLVREEGILNVKDYLRLGNVKGELKHIFNYSLALAQAKYDSEHPKE